MDNAQMVIGLITDNDGNMKSWLCSRFQFTTNADSQFFILRVIGCLLLLNH